MDNSNLNEIVALLVTLANALSIIYFSWKRNKPEVKKLEAESDSEVVEAAERSLKGAEISGNMLIQRINELKSELDDEKKARKTDAEYFRRRIKEIDREARDYRLWAAKLAKQVIEAGKVPVAFVPSMNDTDPLLTAITREQVELEKARQQREQEISKEQKQEGKG